MTLLNWFHCQSRSEPFDAIFESRKKNWNKSENNWEQITKEHPRNRYINTYVSR